MNLSISALRYRLLDGIPCLEPLRVLERRAAYWQGWQVHCYILGASHAVCLEREGAYLTEILTCLPPGGSLRALAEAAADRPGAVCVAAHGLICRACLAPFALCEGDALCENFPAAGRLEVAYPCATGAPPAFTRLGWYGDGKQLRVETIHTYPEEGRGVRTRTEFFLQEVE